jgi:hypothetical protein
MGRGEADERLEQMVGRRKGTEQRDGGGRKQGVF